MEEEQPAAAPIVGEELPGEAELQLEVAQEPGALEQAVAAPSPARGSVIMSRGLRTRDGASLLVRFVNHEGWLEARALDCSGGKVGRIVLCGIADDDAAAQRRLCEELAPRLIVRDGTLALGDAPRPADEGSVADSVQLAEAPAPAPLVEAPAPALNAAAPAPAPSAAEAPVPAAEAPAPAAPEEPEAPAAPAEPPVEAPPTPPRLSVRFKETVTFQSARFGAIDAVDGAHAGGANAFGFESKEYEDVDPTAPAELVRRAAAAATVAELAAMRASIARTRAAEAFHGANLAHHRDNRSLWTGLVATASAKAKWKALSKRKSRVTTLPPARSYDTTGLNRRRQRDRDSLKRWWINEVPPWERDVTAALAGVRTAPASFMQMPRPASAAVDIGAIAAAAVPRLRPKTAPVPRQVVSRRPAPRKPAPAPDGAWPLPHLLRPRVARHREAMESMRRTYRCP